MEVKVEEVYRPRKSKLYRVTLTRGDRQMHITPETEDGYSKEFACKLAAVWADFLGADDG